MQGQTGGLSDTLQWMAPARDEPILRAGVSPLFLLISNRVIVSGNHVQSIIVGQRPTEDKEQYNEQMPTPRTHRV